MAKTVTIERTCEINMPIDAVWDVSAIRFEHIDEWDANVEKSEALDGVGARSTAAGRSCHLYNGRKTVEKITEFDEGARSFTYQIVEGLPGFVQSAFNKWTLKRLGEQKTVLAMKVDMTVTGFLGAILQGPMKSQMGKVLEKAQAELKHFIEQKTVHPRKMKQLRKA